MSAVIVYKRRRSPNLKEFGNGEENDNPPPSDGNWVPDTRKVYTRRRHSKSGSIPGAEEEACDMASASLAATTSADNDNDNDNGLCSYGPDRNCCGGGCKYLDLDSDGLIDLNRSVCNWEDADVTAAGGGSSKDFGEASNGLGAMLENFVTSFFSGDSGKGPLNWVEETYDCQGLGDKKACAASVADCSDCLSSMVSREAVCNDATAETQHEVSQPLVSQASSSAAALGSLNCRTSLLCGTSVDQVDRNSLDRDRETYLSQIDNLLLGPDLENNKNRPQCHLPHYDMPDGVISSMENEKHCDIKHPQPSSPAISTPLPNRLINKRPSNGIDVNKRPHKRSKTKKHRPKIAVDVRSKGATKQTPKPAIPNIASSTPEKREKSVRRAPFNNPLEKREKKKYVRKDLSQQNSVANPEKREKSVRKALFKNPLEENQKREYIRKGNSQPNSVTNPDAGTTAESTLNNQSGDTKMVILCRDHDCVNDSGLWLNMQPSLSKNSGVLVVYRDPNLSMDTNGLRWSTRRTRSAGHYRRNHSMTNKINSQCWSLQGCQRMHKGNGCLNKSRKVGPSFPKGCKKERMKRRRKMHMFGTLAIVHTRKKRSQRSTQPGKLVSLGAIPICTHPLSNIPDRNCQEIEATHKLEDCKDFQITNTGGMEDVSVAVLPKKAIVGEDIQVIGKFEEENSESRIEMSLPHKGAHITEENGPQIFPGIRAENNENCMTKSCIAMGPSSVDSSLKDVRSKGSPLKVEGLQLVAKPTGRRKAFNKKSNAVHKVKAATINRLIHKLKSLNISDAGDLVPYQGSTKRRRRVDLDSESFRMWRQLLKVDDGVGEENPEKQKERWWKAEREVFRGRIDSFSSRMHLFLGDRRFKPWKGSVVDSVVGVYLTQNVSDILSSSAYMALAAKFPLPSTSNQGACCEELDIKASQESIARNLVPDGPSYDLQGNLYFVTESEPDTNHKLDKIETLVDGLEGSSLVEIEDYGALHFGKATSRKEFCSHACKIPSSENLESTPGVTDGTVISHSSNCDAERRALNCESQNVLSGKPISSVDDMGQRQICQQNPACDANNVNSKEQGGSKEQHDLVGLAFDDTRETTLRGKKKTTLKGKKQTVKGKEVEKRDWDSLRKMYSGPRNYNQTDSVNWERVRCAEPSEVAEVIKERGQQTIIGQRIQDFLNRLVELHQRIDLEWLRHAPPDDVKEYLWAIPGLGLKSVECVRLLTLQNIAFPVDTNVGRIAVRLGWVPLQPLPGDVQFHLLEEFPIMDSIQQYLWPRLCTLNARTLYELHYQMITFGKVFCTKKNPNCNVCPMRAECRHFASRVASAKLSLPEPSRKSAGSKALSLPAGNSVVFGNSTVAANSTAQLLLEPKTISESGSKTQNYEPLVEEPESPQHEPDVEDTNYDDKDIDNDGEEIPVIKLNDAVFSANVHYFVNKYSNNLQDDNLSGALVPLSVEAASVPVPKLKYISRLRTEHQVYELPDDHELVKKLERRDPDDHVCYLLAIWTPGETADSCESPRKICNSQGSELCNDGRCLTCESVREKRADIVRGTILIPCRTALKGRFPLNGTYFQVNEVFADHETSYNPLIVPRRLVWHLRRRMVYVGTSTTAIFRGMSTEDIQRNFWTGFVCFRGIDIKMRAPRPLSKRFHCSPSKMEKKRRGGKSHFGDDADKLQ